MSDAPVLQSGDGIHILIGVGMQSTELLDIKEMYETRGIKVVGVTRISGGTFQGFSIIRGKDPVGLMAQMAGPSMPRTR